MRTSSLLRIYACMTDILERKSSRNKLTGRQSIKLVMEILPHISRVYQIVIQKSLSHEGTTRVHHSYLDKSPLPSLPLTLVEIVTSTRVATGADASVAGTRGVGTGAGHAIRQEWGAGELDGEVVGRVQDRRALLSRGILFVAVHLDWRWTDASRAEAGVAVVVCADQHCGSTEDEL